MEITNRNEVSCYAAYVMFMFFGNSCHRLNNIELEIENGTILSTSLPVCSIVKSIPRA